MLASQTPTLVPLAFAANGTKNTIPEASQISITPGAASLNDGFPPLTFTPVAAGGVPPFGADFNGVLNLITVSIRWAHGGGRYAFNSTFVADTNVGGYPQGAVLMSADLQGSWLSLNDSNSDNPDTGAGTKWVPQHAYGVTAITGLTNANVTLTPAQAMKKRITLAGTLTANVQIIFPTWLNDWTVTNNTTGAFTVTCKTASGSGVAVNQGAVAAIMGDGTNITLPSQQNAVGRLINVQTFTSSGTYTPTAGTNSIIVEAVGGGGGAGGCPTQAAGSGALGGSASAGSYIKARITSGFSGVSVTIGAAGTAGTSTTAGGSGGATSFGSFVTCPGGNGGVQGGGATSITFVPGAWAPSAGTVTGASATLLASVRGAQGISGMATASGGVGIGGQGGASPLGLGGSGGTAGSGNVANTPGYGGGAGAAYIGSGQSTVSGVPGGQGVLLVYEFA